MGELHGQEGGARVNDDIPPEEGHRRRPQSLGKGEKWPPDKVNASPIVIEPAPLRRESTFVPPVREVTNTMPPLKYKVTADHEDRIIQVLEGGGTIALAAKAVNLDRKTVSDHAKNNPEFAARVKAAKDLVDDAVETVLFQMAMGKIKTEGKGQVVAIIFWLKNRRPNEWRDAHDLTIRPGENNESQFLLPGGQVLSSSSSGLSVARSNK